MNPTPSLEDAHTQRQHAHRVFTEMLTAVSPEVKEALVALYRLIQTEQQVCRCENCGA